MKKVIHSILLSAFVLFCISCGSVYAAEMGLIAEKSNTQVTVYLKTGDVITGRLLEKTTESVSLEKLGNRMIFKSEDILKIEQIQSEKDVIGDYFLPFKTAIITYTIKGYREGKEILYIDVVNQKVATESLTTKLGGYNLSEDNLTILNGKTFISFSSSKKSGLSFAREGNPLESVRTDLLYYGHPVKAGTFLGKDCKIYETNESNLYFWHGILLKRENKKENPQEHNSFQEATDIQVDVPLPAEKFIVPQGIEVKSMAKIQDELKKGIAQIRENKKIPDDKMRDSRKEFDEMMRQSQNQRAQRYEKELLIRSEQDPAAKKLLKEMTKEDGTFDVQKYEEIQRKEIEKSFLEDIKKMPGGQQAIADATAQDGKVDRIKLSAFFNRNWEEQTEQSNKKRLLDRASHDPAIKKIIEQSTDKEGKIDTLKAKILIDEQDKKSILEKARKFKDGEELIKKATSESGLIDTPKLNSLLAEKEIESQKKTRDLLDAGQVYEQQKDYQEASKTYSKVIELDPSNEIARQVRARLYEKTGEFDKAIEDLTHLIENNLSYFDSHTLVYRAQLYARIKKYQEAINDYSRAIENLEEEAQKKDQEMAKSLLNIGEKQGKIDPNQNPLRRLSVRYVMERAVIYQKMGENEKAILDLTNVIRDAKSDETLKKAYFLRGLIFRQMKQNDKMKADWEKAQSLGSHLSQGEYINSKKEGLFVWYYPDGSVKNESNYLDGKLEGKCLNYYPNGQLSSVSFYKNDKIEGLCIWYDLNGMKIKEGTFKNGQFEGIFKTYDSSTGALTSQMNYANGKLDAEGISEFWGNGSPLEKSIYKNGVRHGISYKYYENGQIQQEIPFENGLQNGTANFYNSDGSLKKKIIFKNGQEVK